MVKGEATAKKLVEKITTRYAKDFSSISFVQGSVFQWEPTKQTIYYSDEMHGEARLLHELAHAELGHSDFSRDITLLTMEREAWYYARTTLAPRYNVQISDEVIQNDLDTYREWLHARSTCPQCTANGIQTDSTSYTCVACGQEWHVNQAITTQLRRTKKIPPQS